MVHSTFQARRALKIGLGVRQPGQLVPEAQTWFRVDHLVHSGQLTRVVVEDEQFDQAVEEFCPDLIEVLYPKEIDVEDNAAKQAQLVQSERVSNPSSLSEHLAAPANTEDPSVSDEAAAVALTADAADDEEVKVDGAHEEFVSDQVPDTDEATHQAPADEDANTHSAPEDEAKADKAAKKASAKKK